MSRKTSGPPPDKVRVLALYKTGKSIREVAAETGSNYAAVRTVLLEEGVLRPRGAGRPGSKINRRNRWKETLIVHLREEENLLFREIAEIVGYPSPQGARIAYLRGKREMDDRQEQGVEREEA